MSDESFGTGSFLLCLEHSPHRGECSGVRSAPPECSAEAQFFYVPKTEPLLHALFEMGYNCARGTVAEFSWTLFKFRRNLEVVC